MFLLIMYVCFIVHSIKVLLKQKYVCIVAAGENGNDLNFFGLYLNKSVMVIIIKIYDRDRFF
jgi:hypothetical protein